jgi:hypothetical protein
MTLEIKVHVWDTDEVARWVRRLALASQDADAGARRVALEIAWGLHHAGQTLAFTDEDDADVVFELLTRLDSLRADAERVLAHLEARSAEADEITRPWQRPSEPPLLPARA